MADCTSARELIRRPRQRSPRTDLDSDAAAIRDIFQHTAIQRWHVRRADSTTEAEGWITQWRAEWSKESGAYWAVADVRSGVVLGRAALKNFDLCDGTADVAYWIEAHARGREICTRALQAVSQWAFRESSFHRLELKHSVDNPVSCRVAEKAGFH